MFCKEQDCEHKECPPLSSPASASVFYVPLFSIWVYLSLLQPSPLIKAPPSHLSLSIFIITILKDDYFPHFISGDKECIICARTQLVRYYIFLLDNCPVILLSRFPSCHWSPVLLQGLWVRIQACFPLA